MKTKHVIVAFVTVFLCSIFVSYRHLEEFHLQEIVIADSQWEEIKIGVSPNLPQSKANVCQVSRKNPWPPSQPMGTLIIGGATFTGYHLAKRLLQEGHKVVAIDQLWDQTFSTRTESHMKILRIQELESLNSQKFSFVKTDSCGFKIIKKTFMQQQISHIVFMGAEMYPDYSKTEYINKTLSCLSQILEFLKIYRSVHFTLISTTTVSNKQLQGENLKEISPRPQDFYSLIQSSLEMLVLLYEGRVNMAITIVRLTSVYGPWASFQDPMHQLLEKTLHSHQARDIWNISSIGFPRSFYMQEQDFLYIDDAVEGVMQTMQARFTCAVLSLGSGNARTFEAVHSVMVRITKDTSAPKHPGHGHLNLPTFLKVPNIHKSIHYPLGHHVPGDKIIYFAPKVSLTAGLKTYISWYKNSRQMLDPSGTLDLVFTSLFTSKSDPQRKKRIKPNRFDYMKTWYWSLYDRELQGIVFHDGLDERFVSKVSNKHLQFKFVTLDGRSTNDARFYAYLRYLQTHPSIHRVLLTDISDVKFQKNPFKLMDVMGDMLYIGTDIDLFPNMASMGWLTTRLVRCFGAVSVSHGEIASVMKLNIVYNAGVIGGTRSLVLEFLQRLTAVLNRTPKYINCNMPAVNYVVHKYFDGRVFTGFPLTSRFMKRQGAPKGVYIVHK